MVTTHRLFDSESQVYNKLVGCHIFMELLGRSEEIDLVARFVLLPEAPCGRMDNYLLVK